MKQILITLIFFSAGVVQAQAQNDSTTQYIQGIPVTDDDTVQNFPREDVYPINKLIVIPDDQLPGKLRKALNKDSQYEGWNKMPVYFDKNTSLYIVQVGEGLDVKRYGFNKNGKPVTFSEYTKPD